MATLLALITVKATVVLMAAWLLTRAMMRFSAASRHLVWTFAMLAVLALPVMQIAGPSWKLPVLPAAEVGSDPIHASTQPLDTTRVMGSDPIAVTDVVAAPAAVTNTPPSPEPASTIDWRVALGLIWLSGVVVALTRLAAGLAWVRRVTARAETIVDADWHAALAETTAALRITGGVSLKASADTTIPVACGIFTPTVLLPMDAAAWPADRRRVVLLHELAHVARRDCLVQALAQLGRAMHWFNPLAHVAVLRLRAEQEKACDDLVLAAGTDAPSYADHLFEIARSFRSGRCPAWATLAMARPSQLEGRVLAILDDRRNRRVPARWTRAAIGVAAAALTLPIGVLQLTAAAPARVRPRLTAGERVAASMAIEPSAQMHDELAQPVQWNDSTVVEAATELVDVIGDLDFDFDFDWYGPIPAPVMELAGLGDADPDPAPEPQPEPDQKGDRAPMPFPNPKFGQSQSQSSSQSSSQSQNNQNNTVSDETRRRVADALMTALNDENADVREQALNALANMRDARAIPGLLRALRDSNVDVREQAVNALAQFDTPEALDGILSALKDASPDVREHAARHMAALGSRGRLNDPKYSDVVSGLLKDSSPDVRQMAIVALGRMRRPESVPLLLPLLKDMSEDVREQAAVSLGIIADPRAIDALTAALKDQTPDVREQAAIALGRIARGQRRGPGGVPPVPPAPPAPPRGVRLNVDEIQELAARAQEEAQRQLQENLDQLERQLR